MREGGGAINLGRMSGEGARPIGPISANGEGVFQDDVNLDDGTRLVASVFVDEDRVIRREPNLLVERKDGSVEFPVAVADKMGNPAQYVLRKGVVEGRPLPSLESIEQQLDLSTAAMKPVLKYDKATGNVVPVRLRSNIVEEDNISE